MEMKDSPWVKGKEVQLEFKRQIVTKRKVKQSLSKGKEVQLDLKGHVVIEGRLGSSWVK